MLKYKKEINEISNCPGTQCEEKVIEAYRFVFDNMSGNSFLPTAVQSPNRFINKSHAFRCSGYALSMFTKKELAKQHLLSLLERIPNIKKSIGDNLACGTIDEQSGICTKTNENGHFAMFEYINHDLTQMFNIIESNL